MQSTNRVTYDTIRREADQRNDHGHVGSAYGNLTSMLHLLRDIAPSRDSHIDLIQQVVQVTSAHQSPPGKIGDIVEALSDKLDQIGATGGIIRSFENLFPWACAAAYLEELVLLEVRRNLPSDDLLDCSSWFEHVQRSSLDRLMRAREGIELNRAPQDDRTQQAPRRPHNATATSTHPLPLSQPAHHRPQIEAPRAACTQQAATATPNIKATSAKPPPLAQQTHHDSQIGFPRGMHPQGAYTTTAMSIQPMLPQIGRPDSQIGPPKAPHLQGNSISTELQNAALQNAASQNSASQNAALQNAKLQNAKLQNAKLQNAKLQNAESQNATQSRKTVGAISKGDTNSSPESESDDALFVAVAKRSAPRKISHMNDMMDESAPATEEELVGKADPPGTETVKSSSEDEDACSEKILAKHGWSEEAVIGAFKSREGLKTVQAAHKVVSPFTPKLSARTNVST